MNKYPLITNERPSANITLAALLAAGSLLVTACGEVPAPTPTKAPATTTTQAPKPSAVAPAATCKYDGSQPWSAPFANLNVVHVAEQLGVTPDSVRAGKMGLVDCGPTGVPIEKVADGTMTVTGIPPEMGLGMLCAPIIFEVPPAPGSMTHTPTVICPQVVSGPTVAA